MDRESIRKSFRPSKISILFVGESPPANGAFFYVCSPMTRYMAQVFGDVLGREFQSVNHFLNVFMAENCYLDDLSYTPVDNLARLERRGIINSCVAALGERMAEYQPEQVIAILKSIDAPVRRAAQLAELHVPVYSIPFPGHGNQRRFVLQLSDLLKSINALVP